VARLSPGLLGGLVAIPYASSHGKNAAIERFFSSLQTERTARNVIARDHAKADMFD
jgi:hypothetical protein